jgi:hypothetical protein
MRRPGIFALGCAPSLRPLRRLERLQLRLRPLAASQPRHLNSRLSGFVVVWLVIAAIAGMGLFTLFEPGSIAPLVTAEL